MKIIDLTQGSEEWLEYRKGKISGTLVSDLYSKRGGRKIGFYGLIAEKIGLEPDSENRMDRGLRLEEEAIEKFEKLKNLKIDRVGLCVHKKYPFIINSPDGLIKKDDKYIMAIEIKCLSPSRHLQAVIEDKIPDEFEAQTIQYFIVNEDLQKLYFMFYDPRIPSKEIHIIEVNREDILDKIDLYEKYQIETMAEINKLVEELAF